MTGGAATPARRVTIHRWRDPRLLLGIMLVLLSTVVGAKVFAARDDTEAFWAVRSAVAAGDQVGRADLVATRIRVSDPVAVHYLRVSDEFPDELSALVWAHDVDAGTLVERSALAAAGSRPAAELPLDVANGSFPSDLHRGDRVDVWVGPAQGQPTDSGSARVLKGVPVLSTGADAKAVGGTLARTILVGAPSADLKTQIVSAISAGHVTLVRVP